LDCMLIVGKVSKSCSALHEFHLGPERRLATVSSSFCGIGRALASMWQDYALTQHQATLMPTEVASL
ncbi:MAG: hypothetical protein M3H12_01045, partial [Chromatiales bacterium]